MMNSLRLVRSAHAGVGDVDVRMMQRAILLARSAALAGEVPIAAVIYRGDEVVAEAANTREREADPTGHAEIVAIRDVNAAPASDDEDAPPADGGVPYDAADDEFDGFEPLP